MPNTHSRTTGLVDTAHEARSEPRISYRLMFLINGINMPTSNISASGAQVCCPSMRYRSFESTAGQKLDISWSLPHSTAVIKCVASVRYANLCEDEYLIGLQLTGFSAHDERAWKTFIASRDMKP